MDEIEGVGPDRLADVFLANRHRLRAFLVARGAADLAEDLLQEMWIKASGIDRDVQPSPVSYLFRMAERLLLDAWRQGKRRSGRDTQWAETNERSEGLSVELAVIARQQVGIVAQRLQALGPRTEQVFRRYRIEGVEQRAIAEEMGVSLSTVEKDLRKAYLALLEIRSGFDAD